MAFLPRLALALKALSMSGGAGWPRKWASISRWSDAGLRAAYVPPHNLDVPADPFPGRKRPGLTLLDWDRTLPEFAALFGVDAVVEQRARGGAGLSGTLQDMVGNAVDAHLGAYEELLAHHACFRVPAGQLLPAARDDPYRGGELGVRT